MNKILYGLFTQQQKLIRSMQYQIGNGGLWYCYRNTWRTSSDGAPVPDMLSKAPDMVSSAPTAPGVSTVDPHHPVHSMVKIGWQKNTAPPSHEPWPTTTMERFLTRPLSPTSSTQGNPADPLGNFLEQTSQTTGPAAELTSYLLRSHLCSPLPQF